MKLEFKNWILQEAPFSGSAASFSKSASPPQGLGDLRQMRRWSYMGRPVQPDYQRVAAAGLGGFGDAFRDTLAGDDGRGLPGSPAHFPGPEEYEDSLDLEVFVSDEDLSERLGGESVDTEEMRADELKRYRQQILDRTHEILNSGRTDDQSVRNMRVQDYDLANPKVYDIMHIVNNRGEKGVRATVSFRPLKGIGDKWANYQTAADQGKSFGWKRGVGNQSVANAPYATGSYSYDRGHRDIGY